MIVRALTLAVAFTLASGVAALAQGQSKAFRFTPAAPGSSHWEKVTGGRVRLVASAPAPDGEANAALEIELEPGFRTYWRNPGKDGIPPQVQLIGSPNVREARMTLPPPTVFRGSSVSVGYTGSVRFPVTVRVANASVPYRLRAAGVLGFCADVCVPVPFDLATFSPMSATLGTASFSAPDALVQPSEGLSLEAARFDPVTMELSVDARVPDTDVLLELVVDGVEGLELPPAASAVHQKGDRATFTFDLAQGTVIAPDQPLDFTLIVARLGQAGRIGIEQRLPVSTVD